MSFEVIEPAYLSAIGVAERDDAPTTPQLAVVSSDGRIPSDWRMIPWDQGPNREFSVSLVIPALNEAEGIRAVLSEVPTLIDEVIVVDGRSTDGTLAVAAQVCPRAICTTQPGRGKGDALKHGLSLATGDIVVTMDADGSMSLADVPLMVDKLLDGCDFVKGSRSLPGAGSADFTPIRRLGNWALTRVANVIFGAGYTDITYGFNAYWRPMMANVDGLSDGFQFEIQAAIRAARAGLKTAEVPCHEHPRVGGVSKLNPIRDGWFILKVICGEALPRRRVEFRAMADLYLPSA